VSEPDLTCRYHGAHSVCDRCPERFGTDGRGFPHPSVRKGRAARRVCHGCGQAFLLDDWNVGDFFHCVECRPIVEGQIKAVPRETERRCVCGNCCCPVGPWTRPGDFTLAARAPRWNACDAGAANCEQVEQVEQRKRAKRSSPPGTGDA
jgi:hypothetical protein